VADVNLSITSNIESILNQVIEQQRAALQAKLRNDQRKKTETEATNKRLALPGQAVFIGQLSARLAPIKRLPFAAYAEDIAAPRRRIQEVVVDIIAGGDPIVLPAPPGLPEDSIAIYFHAAAFLENVLQIKIRLAPTGRAPLSSLGPLFATIASTSVVALLPNGQVASPPASGLPSLLRTGLIAEPWDPIAEGVATPPSDQIFEADFNIDFFRNDFPPEAENPAQQLTYRMTVEFTDWNGGFTDVSFLNTLQVDFVSTEAPLFGQSLLIYTDPGRGGSTIGAEFYWPNNYGDVEISATESHLTTVSLESGIFQPELPLSKVFAYLFVWGNDDHETEALALANREAGFATNNAVSNPQNVYEIIVYRIATPPPGGGFKALALRQRSTPPGRPEFPVNAKDTTWYYRTDWLGHGQPIDRPVSSTSLPPPGGSDRPIFGIRGTNGDPPGDVALDDFGGTGGWTGVIWADPPPEPE
jgi:hypothetical protein